MSRPVIISCAITGGGDTVGKHPAIPVTPAQIADSAVGAAAAGAAIVHIHVRDPASGAPSMDKALYREVVERIRGSGSDVIVNLTTGAGGRFVPSPENPRQPGPGTTLSPPEVRVAHVVELRPEVCSLDMGSMNFGPHVFVNTPAHLAEMARAIRAAGARPELEVFDTGHIRLARHLIERGEIASPPLFQICLGISWGAPATPEAMLAMRNMLPADAIWAAFGIGTQQFPMVAQAVLLGGHVRVGLEDNLYLEKGVFAPTNAAFVEKAAAIVRMLGERPATPAEARAILAGGGASAAAVAGR